MLGIVHFWPTGHLNQVSFDLNTLDPVLYYQFYQCIVESWGSCIIMNCFVMRECPDTVKKGLSSNQRSDFCGYLISNGLGRTMMGRTPVSPTPCKDTCIHISIVFGNISMISWADGTLLAPIKTHFSVGCNIWQQPLHNECFLSRGLEHACIYSFSHSCNNYLMKPYLVPRAA